MPISSWSCSSYFPWLWDTGILSMEYSPGSGLRSFVSIISRVKIIYVAVIVAVIGSIHFLSPPLLAGGLLVSAIGLETIIAWGVSRMIKGPLGTALERNRRDENEVLSYRDVFRFSMPLYFTAF